ARGPGALPADEHHVRHHAAAREAAEEPAGARRRHQRPRIGRPGGVVGCAAARSVMSRASATPGLRDLSKEFLTFLRYNRNVSPHTLRAYETDVDQFMAHLADA